ncbi:TagK domain-containing protein [Ralstonia mojiangensis]|uniref:TagK domain-containing protein n=1 Tax=Ralstonia mojiangensis TaxID=2953895 RepID=UPI002091DFCE|nr:TagK domain-containing protein [Ralstonia mojiangensis]MCO5411088.1 TagK domain-containing protein [Ralstonia mojiangensis]
MSNQQCHSSTGGILDDLVPTSEASPWKACVDDPFSTLRANSATPLPTLPNAAIESIDVLALLSREAAAVLRNPERAMANWHLASPKNKLVQPAGHTDDPMAAGASAQDASLLDLLVGPARIESLIAGPDSLDSALFAAPAMPDVLHLFAGDIPIPERRGITAPLTKREHHLVSMDSAYHPAPAQP